MKLAVSATTLLTLFSTTTQATECSANTKPKSCGGENAVTESSCTLFKACCWSSVDNKCYDNSRQVNMDTALSALSTMFKAANVSAFREKQDESKFFNAPSNEPKTMARGLQLIRAQPLFGGSSFNSNPLAFQQQQQTGWFGNMMSNPMIGSMGGNNMMMMTQMQGMLGRLPTCPVSVPLCKREACQPDRTDLDSDAYACMQIKGCCFDMNLHLYKSFFGAYTNTPTCFRAVKSQLFHHYVNNINPWLPEYSESVAAKLKSFDQESPEQWDLVEQCPYNPQTIIPLASQILQRFSQSASNMYQQPQYRQAMQARQQQMMMTMAMTGGNMNDMVGMMSGGNPLLAFASLNSGDGLVQLGMKVVKALSSDYGWKGIERYECRMYGGCWIPLVEGSSTQGRCVKPFKMQDWLDDQQFVQAVSTALSYDEIDADQTSTTDSSSSSQGNTQGSQGGDISSLFRTFSLGNQFNMGLQNSMGGMGMGGNNMMGMNSMAAAGMMGGNMMGSMAGNILGANNPTMMSLQALGSNNPMGMMMGVGNMDMSSPTNQLAMMQMVNGAGAGSNVVDQSGSVSDFLKNQLEQQRMQFVQQWADQKNDPVCSSIPQEKRQSCGDFSGDINRDMNMCHAKGCCFDAMMWNAAKQADDQQQTQNQNTRSNSPFRTSSTGTSAPSRGRFIPSARGKRQVSSMRSMSVLPNPLLPFNQLEICTWNNPHDGLLGLASLKSVIQPCCERVFCYQPESDSSWASWSQWSGCTASCGGGVRQRSRDCLRDGAVVDMDRCKGSDVEQIQCNINACPYMKSWSQWSQCSASCGKGQSTRTRQCSTPSGCPADPGYETRDCNNGGCFSMWSNWSDCDKPCGNGMQGRNRYCLDYEIQCNGQLEETRMCNTLTCEKWDNWSPVGICQNSKGCGKGMQVYQRECVPSQLAIANACDTYASCSAGAPGCQGVASKQQPCDLSPCPAWSSWSDWSPCEGNKKSRTRYCSNGGTAGIDCLGDSSEEQSCWQSSWSTGRNSNSGWGQTGNWGAWSSWSACSGGQQYRQRRCNVYGGCSGSATEYKNCQSGWGFNNPTFQNQMFGWGR